MPLRQSPTQVLLMLQDRLGREPTFPELLQAMGGMSGEDGTLVADTTDGRPEIPLGLETADGIAMQRPMLPEPESPVGSPMNDQEIQALLRLLVSRRRNVVDDPLGLLMGDDRRPSPELILSQGGFGRGSSGRGLGGI